MKYKLPPELENLVNVHTPDQCLGQFCCLHKPSDHPLKSAEYNWRADKNLMERICDHGIGHPDPDDLNYKRIKVMEIDNPIVKKAALSNVRALSIHACCGCCCAGRG